MGGSRTRAGASAAYRGVARLAAGVLGGALALACSGDLGDDRLAQRCVEVLRYRQPGLASISVESVTRRQELRILSYRAIEPEKRRPVSDMISCRFGPDDPWSLVSATIGERELSAGEIALVNAELLLIDLSEHPERLGGGERRPRRDPGPEAPAPS